MNKMQINEMQSRLNTIFFEALVKHRLTNIVNLSTWPYDTCLRRKPAIYFTNKKFNASRSEKNACDELLGTVAEELLNSIFLEISKDIQILSKSIGIANVDAIPESTNEHSWLLMQIDTAKEFGIQYDENTLCGWHKGHRVIINTLSPHNRIYSGTNLFYRYKPRHIWIYEDKCNINSNLSKVEIIYTKTVTQEKLFKCYIL